MWCGPCQSAARDVQETQDAYSEFNFVYLTLLIDDTQGNTPTSENLSSWKETFDIDSAPVWGGDRNLLTSNPIETGSAIYMDGWPTFYFFDNEMTMKGYIKGYSQETIEAAIESIVE